MEIKSPDFLGLKTILVTTQVPLHHLKWSPIFPDESLFNREQNKTNKNKHRRLFFAESI